MKLAESVSSLLEEGEEDNLKSIDKIHMKLKRLPAADRVEMYKDLINKMSDLVTSMASGEVKLKALAKEYLKDL